MASNTRLRFTLPILVTLSLNTACQTTLFKSASEPIIKENVHLTKANEYARDGLFREAILAFKKAVALEPQNLFIHRNLGIVYVKTGDYHRAAKHLSKALKKYDDNFEVNFYLAEAFRARGQFGKAIYRYNRALDLDPKNTKALKALAWSYHKIRFYAEALATIKKLTLLAPNDSQAVIIKARTLLKLGKIKNALLTIKRGQALAHKSYLPYLKSVEGDLYFRIGKIKKAEETYRESLKDQPLLAGALLGLGKSLLAQNKAPELALDYLERAVRIKPRLSEGLYLLGKNLAKKDPQKSQKYMNSFRKYAAMDPEFQEELFEIRYPNISNQASSVPTPTQEPSEAGSKNEDNEFGP